MLPGMLLMTLAQVLKHFGSQVAVCKALGIGRSSYTYWLKVGYVPYKKQCVIQNLTNNKLVANYAQIHASLKDKFNN